MAVLFTNNAQAALSATITAAATSFSVTAGLGALFPSPGVGDYFYVTLADTAGNLEIVKVTARTTDTFTVVRGQDGTTARAYSAGDKVELRLTKAMLDQIKLDTQQNVTGNLSFTGTGNRITGDFTNATYANRVLVQTSTANSNTYFGLIPSGTALNAQFQVFNSSDPANSSIGTFTAASGTIRLVSGFIGTGTTLPLVVVFGSTEAARFATNGNFLLGSATDNGTDRLQVTGSANITGAIKQNGSQVLHAGNYTSYSPSLTGTGASGSWDINVTGSAGSTPLLSALGSYVWSASTLPTGYNQGIQASFVSAAQGFQSYGSVLTMNAYSGGGSALQLYVPYSASYGGNGLQIRSGNYDVNGGNSWTSWKTLLDSSNYTNYGDASYVKKAGDTMTGPLAVIGQTINGQSHFQWDNATYRNPADWTASAILRRDNATSGINGHIPALVLYNNNGGDQTTVGLSFASAEGATGLGNSVALAGILARKEGAGTVSGWSSGSLNFYVKNGGTRVDAINISNTGTVNALVALQQGGNQVFHYGNHHAQNAWTPNVSGGVTRISQTMWAKTGGNNAVWDGQVYSSEAYPTNVYCQASVGNATSNVIFGLSALDGTTDTNADYSVIDYCWNTAGNGNAYIYENGTQVGVIAGYGTYTASTVFTITYDGANVRYYKDGVVQRTVARTVGNGLYFDSSFYNNNSASQLYNIEFGRLSQHLLAKSGGTMSGPLVINADDGLKATYGGTDGDTWYRGWGMESNRASVYIRPTTNNSANLRIGYSEGSQNWGTVRVDAANFTQNGNQVLHAGNFSSYALPNPGSGTGGRVLINLSGNPAWSDASFTYDPIMGQFRATNFRANVGDSAPTWNFNNILHAGNYTSYALPLTGGVLSGTLTLAAGSSWTVLAPGAGTYNKHVQYIDGTQYTLEAALLTDASNGTRTPITFTWRGGYAATGGLTITGASAAELGGNVVLHAGNYSSYALPLSGGTMSGTLNARTVVVGFGAYLENYGGYFARGDYSVLNSAGTAWNSVIVRNNGAPYLQNITYGGNTIIHAGNVSSYATGMTLTTSVASTSGTNIDFASLPTTVKRVTLMLNGVSLSGTSQIRIRLGYGGGTITTSGYSGVAAAQITGTSASAISAGFDVQSTFTSASNTFTGSVVLTCLTGNTWMCSGVLAVQGGTTAIAVISGSVALSGTLDRVRLTSVNGTDTFDAGTVNIVYE